MKNLTQKRVLLFALFVLMGAPYTLHAAKSVYQPIIQLQKGDSTAGLPRSKRKLLVHGYCRKYDVPKEVGLLIVYFVYDNRLKYKNEILPKDLKSITALYSKLNNNAHKAKLLQVASAFSQLPFYEDTEFYIKLQYWSSELLQLKKLIGNPCGQQLVCSLQQYLEVDAEKYCWATKYPQGKVNIEGKAPHANFDTYLKDFKGGLTNYQCKAEYSYGFNYYKKQITKNIEGIAATYPHIKEKQLQQDARGIAHALSKSYQIQQMAFLNHYLFFQNQLIQLKKSVGVRVKNTVYYNGSWTYALDTLRLE